MKNLISRLPQKNLSSFLDTLYLILGIIGIVGGVYYALYFPNPGYISIILCVVLGLVLSYLYQRKQYHQMFVLTLCLIAFIIFTFFLFSTETKSVLEQLKVIVLEDYYLKFDEVFKNIRISYGLLPLAFFAVIAIPLIYLVVLTTYQPKWKPLKLVGCLLTFLFPVSIRHELNLYTSYCFVFYIFYVFVFQYILKYQKNQVALKVILTFVLTIFLMMSHLFLEPNPIFKQNSTSVLSQINYWIDSASFSNLFESQNTTGMNSSVSGKLPTGNIRLDDGLALTIHSDIPFTSYLRGYSLAHYEKNQWKPIQKNYENNDSLKMFSQYLNRNYGEFQEASVQIETQKSTRYQFVPYYPIIDQDLLLDSYYLQKEKTIKTMVVDMYHYSNYLNGSYHFDDEDYQSFTKQEYLDVPTDLKGKLNDFIKEQTEKRNFDLSHLKMNGTALDYANYVKSLLGYETEYDINAGTLPNAQDFVEYFLFQNKKGSCTHYATTGALMLRCLGIPTRYVSGFVMKESDFKDGVAQIPNYRSHAWVEVYLPHCGWVPFEMTPAQSVENQANILDELVSNPPATPNNPNQNNPNQPTTNTPTPTEPENPVLPNESVNENHWYDVIVENSQFIITGLGIIGLIICYRYLSLHFMKWKLRKYTSNQKIIGYYQRMKKIGNNRLSIPDNLLSLATKAKFSQHHISDEEMGQYYQDYLSFIKKAYQCLPLYQKVIYKYIKGYL